MIKYVDAKDLRPKTNYHDRYGKQVMQKAAGHYFHSTGPSPVVKYKGKQARIDGTVRPSVAVEIEAGTYAKHVRGAVLDLICHNYPKKLLVLVPVDGQAREIAEQSRSILEEFVGPSNVRVVVLKGSGKDPHLEEDAVKVRDALRELGWEGFPIPRDQNHGR